MEQDDAKCVVCRWFDKEGNDNRSEPFRASIIFGVLIPMVALWY